MIISLQLAVFMVLLLIFIYTEKILTLPEILACWVFFSMVDNEFVNVVYHNLKAMEEVKTITKYWAAIIHFQLTSPILMIWFLQFYCGRRTVLSRILLLAVWPVFFTAEEVALQSYGYLKFNHWNALLSLIHWLSILIIVLAFLSFFRKKLHAER